MPATRTGRRVPPPAIDPMPSPYHFDTEVHSPSTLVQSPQVASTSASTSTTPHTPLFPASSTPAPRRPSHHKKRPASHIPRPPNAFILFRANFIRDRHLQTTATGPLSNVSPTALSTIVGITWRNLPEEERQIWVEKARVAREEHKLLHPSYRYQPLPTAEERAANRENKRKVKEENIPKTDIERCQEISRLLVEGHRGPELEELLAKFDASRPVGPSVEASSSTSTAGSHPTRSSSLPTPARRRRDSTRTRSRAYSASASPELAGVHHPAANTQSPAYIYDSRYTQSPELHEDGQVSMSETPSAAEHGLPDLTYDDTAPSPLSINLPEPAEGYIQSGLHQATTTPHYSHLSMPSISQRDSPQSFLPSPPFSAPIMDRYPSSFSALTSWDNTHPNADQSSYQFSYFAAPSNDHVMIPETHIPQDLAPPHISADHPYASPIPPFQLYHTLKSFEQSCDAGFPSPPSPTFHAIANEYFYDRHA